ncbi:hypothetical protein OH77DRAFT_1503040 [Trametes cingulata]|nr:hypothetical protein OH77DRAFT_1503040 [Trametes cingulata]
MGQQDIRDRVLSDEKFRTRLVEWLEWCHKGEYSSGQEVEIAERVRQKRGVKADPEADLLDAVEREAEEDGFRDPCTMLPARPPACVDRGTADKWFKEVCEETDEIVYLSNRHDSRHNRGCLRGEPKYCKARYPREVRDVSTIDASSGAILLKKREPWINTYNVIVSYLLRCNTDVTCLLSGTQVKAVIAYVTDYITKSPLKTYSVFEAIKACEARDGGACGVRSPVG